MNVRSHDDSLIARLRISLSVVFIAKRCNDLSKAFHWLVAVFLVLILSKRITRRLFLGLVSAASIGATLTFAPEVFAGFVPRAMRPMETPSFRRYGLDRVDPRDTERPIRQQSFDGFPIYEEERRYHEPPPTNDAPPSPDRAARDPKDAILRSLLEMRLPDWTENWDIITASGNPHSSRDDHVISKLDPDDVNGLRAVLAKDPVTSRLTIDNWRSLSSPSISDLRRIVDLSKERLPGKNLQVGLFLDPIVFRSARQDIKTAAGERPVTEMGPDNVLDSYFASLRGETLLVVGHVEKSYFVQRGMDGKVTLSAHIPDLIARARKFEVTLIPIGCRSARAGSPFGFMQNISTDQVVEVLQALPAQDPHFADLFAAFAKAGDLEFNIEKTRSFIELAIVRPNQAPVTRFKIYNPYPIGAQNAQRNLPVLNSYLEDAPKEQQFAAVLDRESQPFRPWWNRGAMERIWQKVDQFPWVQGGIAGWITLLLWPLSDGLYSLQWWYKTRARITASQYLRRGSNAVIVCGALVVVATIVRAFITGYDNGLFYVGVILVFVVSGVSKAIAEA